MQDLSDSSSTKRITLNSDEFKEQSEVSGLLCGGNSLEEDFPIDVITGYIFKQLPAVFMLVTRKYPVADRGGRGGHIPPGPVKISHKKDGYRRQPHRFHVSRPPLHGCWIRY